MTRYVAFLLLSLSACFPVKAQTAKDEINPAAINYNLIARLFSEKLDSLRRSKKLSTLPQDELLAKTAKQHSEYMLKYDTLTHDETTAGRKTPFDRVRVNGGTHDAVGENVLFTYLHKATVSKKGVTRTNRSYADAAADIFTMWRNSPGHYKNMINPDYEVQGLGLTYNPVSQKLYATQVFGKVPYSYPPAIRTLLADYKISPENKAICAALDRERIRGYRIAGCLFVREGKIYFYIANGQAFRNTFKDPTDQLAIDIVFRDQFPCGENNHLNGSPYYDGLLLKPVPFLDLFKRNTGTNGRLYAYVCDLPPQLAGREFGMNALLIKNNCLCDYSYKVKVESKEYDLIDLQPFWDTLQSPLVTDTFHVTIRQKIRFERGKSTVRDYDMQSTIARLQSFGPYIRSMKMNACSSVEGSEAVNKSLQSQRAAGILQKLRPYIPAKIKPAIRAEENWDMFFRQISGTKYAYLRLFDKSMIKTMLKQDSLKKNLEPLLEQERFVEFEIEMVGQYDNFSNADLLSLGVVKALNRKDYPLAHQIQSRIIQQYLRGEATLENISDYEFDKDTTVHPFFVNLLAAKCLNPMSDEFPDKERLNKLFRKFEASPHARFNYCVYAINYMALTMDTLLSPLRLFELTQKAAELAPPAAVNSMMLNFHLASVKYCTHINDLKAMEENLDAIHELFKRVRLNKATAYKLGLYFSGYNMVNWTVELLQPYIPGNKEEHFFRLYLAAGACRFSSPNKTTYEAALKKYVEMYPLEYQEFIEENFQLMREDLYKDPFCRLKGD